MNLPDFIGFLRSELVVPVSLRAPLKELDRTAEAFVTVEQTGGVTASLATGFVETVELAFFCWGSSHVQATALADAVVYALAELAKRHDVATVSSSRAALDDTESGMPRVQILVTVRWKA